MLFFTKSQIYDIVQILLGQVVLSKDENFQKLSKRKKSHKKLPFSEFERIP